MTTTADKKLERFFDSVVNCLLNKSVNFHWPSGDCFNRSCRRGGATDTGVLVLLCNWKDIMILSAWFLKYGPEVDDDWKRVAREGRFNPSDLHDIFLGIFVGGDGWLPANSHPYVTLEEALMDAAKAVEAFSLQMSNPNPK